MPAAEAASTPEALAWSDGTRAMFGGLYPLSVLGYARTFFIGGQYRPEPLPSLNEEVIRFHDLLEDLARYLEAGSPLLEGVSAERLLQGPFADAMTHAGQLAMLRRLAGVPVPPENFILADIEPDRLAIEQAEPVSPDEEWAEAPAGWLSPSERCALLKKP